MCRKSLVVLAMFAGSVVAVNCGGSSGARTGTGGSSATGAGGGAGSGGSGSGGAGGSSTTGGLQCNPGLDPARALITDFSDWDNTAGKWGMINGLRGSKFGYSGADKTNSVVTAAVTNGALVLSGMVAASDYAGGGMSFDSCVNTTMYHGIQFTLGGTTAGCDLVFNVQTFEQQSSGNGGGCDTTAGSCYSFPKANLTFGTSPITVMFADLTNQGTMPTASEIVGLQWQFQSPAPKTTPPPATDAGTTTTTDDGSVADAPISTDDAAMSTDAGMSMPEAGTATDAAGPPQSGCTGIAMTIDDVTFVP
jgi:hypothetical protein